VHPEVLRLRDLEREHVVLDVALADEDLDAVDDDPPLRAPLAAHPSALPAVLDDAVADPIADSLQPRGQCLSRAGMPPIPAPF